MRNPALDAWATTTETTHTRCSRRSRRDGPVHEVTLADGHRAWLIAGHEEAKAAASTTPACPRTCTPHSPVTGRWSPRACLVPPSPGTC